MGSFLQDLQYGLRGLRRAPGFALVAVLTLALGIGANSAIFSVLNAALLHPLPFPEPERLVNVGESLPERGLHGNGTSYRVFQDWQEQSQAFEAIAAYQFDTVTLTGHGEAQAVPAATVSWGMFAALKVTPIAGRAFSRNDDEPGAAPVVLVSERLWRQQFAGDPGVLGRSLMLNGRAFTVVGILPARFQFPYSTPAPQIWIPVQHLSWMPVMARGRGGHYLRTIARLKPGVALPQAQADMQALQARLQHDYPDDIAKWQVELTPLEESLSRNVRRPLLLLLAAVGLLLLVACINVANLLLARATGRAREMAVRAALGARRARIVRQLLTESLLLGGLGGAVGLAMGWALLHAITSLLPSDLPRAHDISMDGAVLGFSLAIAIVCSLLFSLAPAWQSSPAGLGDAMKEGARAGETRQHIRLRSGLIVAEVAFSLMLLAGAALLIRSLQRLQAVDPGYNPQNVLTFGLELPRQRYARPEEQARFFASALERLRALPGVQGAAAAMPLPLSGSRMNLGFEIAGRPAPVAEQRPSADYSAVSPDFLRVMQIQLRRGRWFSESDAAESPAVCVISESFARQFFLGEDPVGQSLAVGFRRQTVRRIVGIVADAKFNSLDEPPTPHIYVAQMQDPLAMSAVALRAPAAMQATLAGEIRTQIGALDRELPVEELAPMSHLVEQSITPERFRTLLLSLFAAIALALGAVGIYGVISYTVSSRRHEIGVRVALGGTRADILRLVLGSGLRLIALGVVIGIMAALALGRYIGTLLYGVSAADPLSFAVVSMLLVGCGLASCYVPARRATRVEPMEALRYE